MGHGRMGCPFTAPKPDCILETNTRTYPSERQSKRPFTPHSPTFPLLLGRIDNVWVFRLRGSKASGDCFILHRPTSDRPTLHSMNRFIAFH